MAARTACERLQGSEWRPVEQGWGGGSPVWDELVVTAGPWCGILSLFWEQFWEKFCFYKQMTWSDLFCKSLLSCSTGFASRGGLGEIWWILYTDTQTALCIGRAPCAPPSLQHWTTPPSLKAERAVQSQPGREFVLRWITEWGSSLKIWREMG